ncbi:UNVERIFIED_CONTAM: peptidyl-prolyl cis-trans isomerase C [Acetivibrio alkalicellulosi]
MKKKKKLLFVVSLILVFAMFLGGCNSEKINTQDKQQTQDERSLNVVAQVNGNDILYSEFYETLSYLASRYGIDVGAEIEEEWQLEMLEDLKDQALEQVIEREVIIQKAEEAGYIVNDEAIQKATEQFNEIIGRIAADIENSDTSEDSDRDYMQEALEQADEELAEYGKTKDSYIEEAAQYKVMEDFLEEILKDVASSDDELRDYYNKQLQKQREDGIDPWGGEVSLIQQPEGRRVKHILIGLDNGNKTLDEIKPIAEEVLQKARNGSDFEALIEEYGEDPGMMGNDDGYIVAPNGQFVPEFESTSLALEEGEISDLVPTQFGYHIIKAYDYAQEIVFTFEEKKDELSMILDNEKKTEYYSQKIEEWKAASIINRFPENI